MLKRLGKKFLMAFVTCGANIGNLYKYKIIWRKPSQKYIARKVYQKKDYEYLKIMTRSVLNEQLINKGKGHGKE